MYAAQAAAKLMGVECYTYDEGRRGFEFIGREELIELATETMMYLFRQIEAIYKQSLPKGMTQRERAEFRKTFKAACALRVLDRAIEVMRDIRTNERAAQAATGHNALVVAGYYQMLREEIREFERLEYAPSPEQIEREKEYHLQRFERAQDEAAREDTERRADPQGWRERDREYERWRKRQERNDARRTGPRERQMPRGSGTGAGWAAGDRVKLRKEVE
jgi:hypothetical protein